MFAEYDSVYRDYEKAKSLEKNYSNNAYFEHNKYRKNNSAHYNYKSTTYNPKKFQPRASNQEQIYNDIQFNQNNYQISSDIEFAYSSKPRTSKQETDIKLINQNNIDINSTNSFRPINSTHAKVNNYAESSSNSKSCTSPKLPSDDLETNDSQQHCPIRPNGRGKSFSTSSQKEEVIEEHLNRFSIIKSMSERTLTGIQSNLVIVDNVVEAPKKPLVSDSNSLNKQDEDLDEVNFYLFGL